MAKYQVGQVVALLSGSPQMTVKEVKDVAEESVQCVYWSNETNSFELITLPEAALYLIS